MYVKVIDPKVHGKQAYTNTGSARRATNYLEQEAKANEQLAVFFSSPGQDELSSDEVVRRLDSNHGKLANNVPKFHSLVLSPSQRELATLDGGTSALVAYTRHMMQTYAENFSLRDRHKLGESDLVWAATIHHERKYRGNEEGLQGDYKPGLQTHVHVVVSALDATQRIRLNPLGIAAHFNRVRFQAEAGVELDERLGWHLPRQIGAVPDSRTERVVQKAVEIQQQAALNRTRKALTPEQQAAKEARLDKQVIRLNAKADESYQLVAERVKLLARDAQYDTPFFSRLRKLECRIEQGNYLPDPYAYLRSGKARESDLTVARQSHLPAYRRAIRPVRAAQEPAIIQSLSRAAARIAQALTPPSRTQEVREEQEKPQKPFDFEHQM